MNLICISYRKRIHNVYNAHYTFACTTAFELFTKHTCSQAKCDFQAREEKNGDECMILRVNPNEKHSHTRFSESQNRFERILWHKPMPLPIKSFGFMLIRLLSLPYPYFFIHYKRMICLFEIGFMTLFQIINKYVIRSIQTIRIVWIRVDNTDYHLYHIIRE